MTSLLSPTAATAPWIDVATTAGVKAQATGTLLWHEDVDYGGHVKGTITLQRRMYATGVSAWGGIEFRLTYEGHDADDPNASRLGAVVLPSKVGWDLAPPSKCKSQHTKARVVAATFPTNQIGLSRIRILIPFDGNGEKEKVMGEAMVSADLQCRSAIAANTPRTPKTPKQSNASAGKRTIKDTPKHPEYTTMEALNKTPLKQRANAKKAPPAKAKMKNVRASKRKLSLGAKHPASEKKAKHA